MFIFIVGLLWLFYSLKTLSVIGMVFSCVLVLVGYMSIIDDLEDTGCD